MANNIAVVVPRLLAQGLLALRQQAIMPRLVNNGYSAMAGERGSTIEIPIPSAVAATAVTPDFTAPAGSDIVPTKAVIQMTQWYEAAFTLSDSEQMQVMEGTIPMQASEAVKALANNVDTYILNCAKQVFNTAGTAGTTPFATDLSAYFTARKKLNNEAAPVDDRRVVMDANAESNALANPQFLNFYQAGSTQAVQEGQIGRKVGADWYLDQNVPTFTAGAWGGAPVVAGGTGTLGATVISVSGLTASQAFANVGDVINFAGSTQDYVVTAADAAATAGGAASVTIYPPLRSTVANGAAITKKASHVMNLAFHRDAFAFVSRPLLSLGQSDLGVIQQSAVDPVSGLTLRLEVSRQYKRIRWSFDILYGAACIRPELAARILG